MTPPKPFCFVLMPFGRKKDPAHPRAPAIDFDAIYRMAIAAAIEDAGLVPIRADEEQASGIIHKPMFERLLLCDFAVADLTIPNANVFYELGVRHATRHNTTLPIVAETTKLPFDVALIRAVPYRLGKGNAFGEAEADELRTSLAGRLKSLRDLARRSDVTDSPVFQLVSGSQQGSLPADSRLRRLRDADTSVYELLQRYAGHEKTDIFRDLVSYSEARKRDLEEARGRGGAEAVAALDRIRGELELDVAEAGVIVDLYLSYRAVSAWNRMVSLFDDMPAVLQRSVLVREQLAFALNRLAGADSGSAGLRDRAIRVLQEVLGQVGPSSETFGLLGRIYKDLWQQAQKRAEWPEARGYLAQAVDAYARGFEADWRDAYPGINAVTLLDVEGSPGSAARKDQLLPVVRFAVMRKIAGGAPDYWDYATLLELSVLDDDRDDAARYLGLAISHVREPWESATTAGNLACIRDARLKRGHDVEWLSNAIDALKRKAGVKE